MKIRITRDQLLEWIENPVTQHLKEVASSYTEDLREVRGPNIYVPYEPQKTQENCAQLVGQETAWNEVLEALEGNWLIFSEGEESDGHEYFRYLSEGE